MILTEEELKLKERAFSTGVMPKWEFDQIMYSHRNLLSANAELSFKNAEQRKTIDHQHILLDKYQHALDGGYYE